MAPIIRLCLDCPREVVYKMQINPKAIKKGKFGVSDSVSTAFITPRFGNHFSFDNCK
jgi:hypothetical protein